ncbi:MAG: type II secretion system inner membrane protein GspF [Bdellovibrionota bacterium]
MPVFEYRGIDKTGKTVRGIVDSENQRTARLKLKRDGVFITELANKQRALAKKQSQKPGSGTKVNVQDLSMMTRQLATLIKANVPLVESLSAVSEQVENPTLKEACSELRNQVNEGSQLHKSMRKYPKIFNNIYVSMVEAGEMSGTLDIILLRLAEFTEAQNELNSKVKSAMMYPVIMMLFTLGMLFVLFIFVIPKITQIFEDSDKKLPWFSEIVINLSGVIVNYWHIIIVVGIAVIVMFRSWKATPAGSDKWDEIVLQMPVVGKMARLIAVSRFTRTLSTLLAGGVPMLQSMDIVRHVVNNAVLAKAVDQARENISEGESIAGPLKKSEEFPPLVITMISIGEKTGDLENMLTQVSDAYDFQVKNSIQGLTSLLEPIMIVSMGLVIGIIVFAIMMPIIEMSQGV